MSSSDLPDYHTGSKKKNSLESEITCSCNGRYQSEKCDLDTPSGGVANPNNPSGGLSLCEEGDLSFKIKLEAYKAANLGEHSN